MLLTAACSLAAVSAGLVAARPAQALVPIVGFCSDSPTPPCLTSFSRDGVALTDFSVYRVVPLNSGSDFRSFEVEKYDGSVWQSAMGDAEMGHTFAMGFDFGTFNPRTAGGHAQPTSTDAFTLGGSAGHLTLALQLQPVHLVNGCFLDSGSSSGWTCPFTGTSEETGALSFAVNDASWIGTTEAEHQRWAGYFNFYNADYGERPPEPITDPDTGAVTGLEFFLQNSHESPSNVVFVGAQHIRLPNELMQNLLGVPDPETMTGTSLNATINGNVGTAHIRTDSGDAMLIDLTGVTFSKRQIRVTLGTITPTRPSHVHGKRLGPHRATISFDRSRARGARPTGYAARCISHRLVVSVRGHYPSILVTGLHAGRRYTCQVRARSKVGPGPWSASVRV